MSAFTLFGIMILSAILTVFALVKGNVGEKPVPPPSGMAGYTYLGEADDSPVLMRWDALEGAGLRPAPPLALRIRFADRYAWWFTGGGSKRVEDANPRGPEEVHLLVIVPGADSFPPSMFEPLCEETEQPFQRCQDGLFRMIVHRLPFHTDADRVLMGMDLPPVDTSLPYDQRPTQALLEFWTQTDPADGRRHLAGWACPSGAALAKDTAPPLATLLGAAPDPKLACFEPAGWWQRLMPERAGFDRHRVYFRCEPKSPCQANFYFEGRHVELQSERFREGMPPWMDLAAFVAAWETLERMRSEAAHEPPPMAELAEARVQLQTCKGLVAEGQRWVSEFGGLADDPGGLRPFTAWQQRSLPCRKAGEILARLAQVDYAKAEPPLSALLDSLQSLEAHDVEALLAAQVTALEKAGRANSRQMLEALVASAPYLRQAGEYDRRIAEKSARLEQAWSLALSIDPPPSFEQSRAILSALADMRSFRQNAPGKVKAYEEWVGLLERQQAAPGERLIALQGLAGAHWADADFPALKGDTDRIRDIYLTLTQVDPEQRDAIAGAAFNAVFNYRNYAFSQSGFAEVGPHIEVIVARMAQDLGIDSSWYKAARFHQEEVMRRRPAADGTPIGGGFLGS